MTVAVVTDLSDSPAVLRGAADLIEANGLQKWANWEGAHNGDREELAWEPGMPLCALAALFLVSGKDSASAIEATPAVHALVAYLSGNANMYAGFSAGRHRYYEISNWSDKRTTSQADVVGVMRKVAEIEESRITTELERRGEKVIPDTDTVIEFGTVELLPDDVDRGEVKPIADVSTDG